MSRSLSAKKLTAVLLFLVLCAGVPLATFITHVGHSAHAASSSLPYHKFADGPYHVSGNQIIGADNTPYIFHGVGRDGLEFECTGDPFLDSAHLAFMGPGTSGPGATYWWGNTVRLPLSESIWLNGDAKAQCTAAQYQNLISTVVNTITNTLHLNVVIALMWTDAGGTATGAGAGFDMADADSVTFWTQVAGIYKSNPNVLFELYNEPHPTTWACWATACPITDTDTLKGAPYTYTGVGLQALVNTVRKAGATNVAIVAGMNWGYDLSQVPANPITDSGNNLAYDTHPYSPYAGKTPADWDGSFGFLTKTKPVMSLESGEYDCGSQYMGLLLNYLDAHQMSWTGWAWFSSGSVCGYPQIVTDWQGTPSSLMGVQELDQLLTYAGQPIPPPPTPSPTSTPIPSLGGPVSKIWYFPEGRAGNGFKEWLTLENPNSTLCTVTIAYLAQPDGKPTYTVTRSVNVPATSRMTEWVDGDLGTSPNGPGISDAAQINVNTGATPGCTGIVAERPLYFNFTHPYTNSGSDVIGMTKLATTFYFGDLLEGNQPGGGSYSSYITILNPVGGGPATVTAKYYSGGNLVATQNVNVAGGSRGTITPTNVPARSVVVVTSTAPVAVERPTYFGGINGGQAGIVSGGADVVGVQTLSNDWLFAEGYTAQQFQENLVIANVDPVNKPATVTIALESSNGGTPATYTVTVNPNSQVVWNVNSFQKNQSLSAEVTSTGANILVEREMYFKYLHNANGRSLTSVGGSDVLGQPGPTALNNYGFAEGYVNVGYDEWLTIQNPTATPETINISIVNEAGGYFTTAVKV
ncbi:MAG TPA: cellulase family glycosylhydrolase, partial [Ktedonobacteraceae bacterium]|nr:cellulase family glycosylhydrolase [Ktedonobacteraceae bacterium]